MSWFDSSNTQVLIFPVGRGNAAFVRTGFNQGYILDMGGGGDFCDPAAFIKEHCLSGITPFNEVHKITQAILSHPHNDHISQCAELDAGEPLSPGLLTCPNDKLDGEKVNWSRIENPDDNELLKTYQGLFEGTKRGAGLQSVTCNPGSDMPDLAYGIYYVRPPVCNALHEVDNEYGNATSLMFYLRHGDHSILFPGDMTPEGMSIVLKEEEGAEKRFTTFDSAASAGQENWNTETCDQPSLSSLLEDGLSLLIAPHHGLESCYSEELYEAIGGEKPELVIISERRKTHENDGSTDARYQSEDGASGLTVQIEGENEDRYSISTINGHFILIEMGNTGDPVIRMEKDLEKIVEILEGIE